MKMHCDKGKSSDLPKSRSTSDSSPTKLEFPSEELVLLRKQILVEKLMKTTAKATSGPSSCLDEDSTTSVRDTIKLGPSSVLSRVKEFLPMMKIENERLRIRAEENPAAVLIEVDNEADDNDEEVEGQSMVEVNLALVPQSNQDDDNGDSDTDPSDELFNQEDKCSPLTSKDILNPLSLKGSVVLNDKKETNEAEIPKKLIEEVDNERGQES